MFSNFKVVLCCLLKFILVVLFNCRCTIDVKTIFRKDTNHFDLIVNGYLLGKKISLKFIVQLLGYGMV